MEPHFISQKKVDDPIENTVTHVQQPVSGPPSLKREFLRGDFVRFVRAADHKNTWGVLTVFL